MARPTELDLALAWLHEERRQLLGLFRSGLPTTATDDARLSAVRCAIDDLEALEVYQCDAAAPPSVEGPAKEGE